MITRSVIALIRFYRWSISPFLRPSCRYEPTCSAYAIYAIEFHGLSKGLWMATKRLLRCHPVEKLGGNWGFDPVPKDSSTRQVNS